MPNKFLGVPGLARLIAHIKTAINAAGKTAQADQVTFEDGRTFQQLLDEGALKGDKGDPGQPGEPGQDGVVGVVDVAHGGTGCEELADGELLIGSGTGAVQTEKIWKVAVQMGVPVFTPIGNNPDEYDTAWFRMGTINVAYDPDAVTSGKEYWPEAAGRPQFTQPPLVLIEQVFDDSVIKIDKVDEEHFEWSLRYKGSREEANTKKNVKYIAIGPQKTTSGRLDL